jgi:glycosyltransferase involved in cell wall biosynthesis
MTIIIPPPLCGRPDSPNIAVGDEWDYVPLSRSIPITEQKWPLGTRALVSVLCITYNHGSYIRKTIEGFLTQETTFPIQILIHDDASSDETATIIREYEADHPHLFLIILQPKNLFSRGVKIEVTHLLRGKYIAFCEGDDYWTHPWKLQTQCNYLLQNPDVSLVYHPVLVLDEKDVPQHDYTQPPRSENHRKFFVRYGNFIHTPSVVLLNTGVPLPPEAASSPAKDFFWWLLALNFGRMHMLPITMAVYRVGSGVWSSMSGTQKSISTITILMAAREYCFRVKLDCEYAVLGDRIVELCKTLYQSISEEQLCSWSMIGPSSALLVDEFLRPAVVTSGSIAISGTEVSKLISNVKKVTKYILGFKP